MISPRIILKGDPDICQSFIGFGKKQLGILQNLMNFRGLRLGNRTLSPYPGVVVQCDVVYGNRVIIINSKELEERLKKEKKDIDRVVQAVKIFVHVDVIGQEVWNSDESDTLTRSLVTSGLACGIVSPTGDIIWQSSMTHDYLVKGTSTDWEGVEGDRTSTDQEIIEYYDAVWVNSPYAGAKVPDITTDWLTGPSWNSVWNLEHDYMELDSAYKCTLSYPPYECSLVTAAESGFCNSTEFYHTDNGLTDPEPDYYTVEYADAYKFVVNDVDAEQDCGVSSFAYRRHYPYGTSGFGDNLLEHTHSYCSDSSPTFDEYVDFCRYWQHINPTLGKLHDGYIWNLYREHWTQVGCAGYHYVGWDTYEFREIGSNSMSYDYVPYAYRSASTVQVDYLVKVGADNTANYISDGFNWFFGYAGGIRSTFDEEYRSVPADYIGSKTCRTLIGVGGVAGYGASPFGYGNTNSVSSAIAELLKAAVYVAGGNVYATSAVPSRSDDAVENYITTMLGEVPEGFDGVDGVVYASPLLNLRVTAFPLEVMLTDEDM